MTNYFEHSDKNKKPLTPFTICVVGLGYIGTPLA
ncbi:MAG: hypothetical protein BWY45_02931 [Euryarchaeota archaeon ADurb.Bin294]|nr:MAG: hypothetical protein BWY45_02931 [Euryarchaeota archaeon ADurb.Bin294]